MELKKKGRNIIMLHTYKRKRLQIKIFFKSVILYSYIRKRNIKACMV